MEQEKKEKKAKSEKPEKENKAKAEKPKKEKKLKKEKTYKCPTIKSEYNSTKCSFLFMVLAIVITIIGIMSVSEGGIAAAVLYAIGIVGVALILFSPDFLKLKKVYKIIIHITAVVIGILLLCVSFKWIKLQVNILELIIGLLVIIFAIYILYVSIKKKYRNVYLVVASFITTLLLLTGGILYCCLFNANPKSHTNLSIAAGIFLILSGFLLRFNPIYRVKKD